MNKIVLEVCVDDAEGLAAAIAGGADRIELCSALSVGGLTPSVGLMQLAASANVPVVAMIRPRAGNFIWAEDELRIMEAEILAARQAGLAGVVIGAGLLDGRLDKQALQRLVTAAAGLEMVLHRVVDLAPDGVEVVNIAKELGICRILTSGGARKAVDGLERLAAMRAAAGDGITIMPGSGINVSVLPVLASALGGLTEVHASCSMARETTPELLHFGFELPGATRATTAKVAEIRAALDSMASSAGSTITGHV